MRSMAVVSTDIKEAAKWLRAGEVVAIPTETVYGLAANALNVSAVKKVYEVKNRPETNPLIIHVSGAHVLKRYTREVPLPLQKLADTFWPGPLTLLLEKNPIVPDATTSGSSRVAVRVPDHPLTLALLRELDFPLAAPSANPFGYISPTRPEHVIAQLGERIPMVLDGGACTRGIESTIVGMENSAVCIYRMGMITEEDIQKVVGPETEVIYASHSKPVAPGMLPWHYAPHTPLYLFEEKEGLPENLSPETTMVIVFQRRVSGFPHQVVLSEEGSLEEAANRLYDVLIESDKAARQSIYCQRFPDHGLGKSLNERLFKAAGKK